MLNKNFGLFIFKRNFFLIFTVFLAAMIIGGCGSRRKFGVSNSKSPQTVSKPKQNSQPKSVYVAKSNQPVTNSQQTPAAKQDVAATQTNSQTTKSHGNWIPSDSHMVGVLTIKSSPLGADVKINGKHAGQTPLLLKGVPEGEHTIQISKSGFKSTKEKVMLWAGQSLNVNKKLTGAGTSTVVFKSQPKRASIIIEEKEIGITPLKTSLKAGNYTAVYKLKGHFKVEKQFSVTEGSSAEVFQILNPWTGEVKIETQPPGAKIFVNKRTAGTTPTNVQNLPEGSHIISLKKEGYYDEEIKILCGEGKNNVIRKSLRPHVGEISISTAPKGAIIKIDGNTVGKSNKTIKELAVGQHTIAITKKGYLPINEIVELTVDQKIPLSFNLKQWAGEFSVVSEPEGADVFVNGKHKGVTPLLLNGIKKGKRSILLKKDGFKNLKFKIVVKEDMEKEINKKMDPKTGNIKVSSKPKGASIIIDGQDTNKTTPATIKKIAVGQHKIEVKKHGYILEEKEITIKNKKTARAKFDLNLWKGTLKFESNPKGVKAYINNKSACTTPCIINDLSHGQHSIKLELDGYYSQEFEFMMTQGEDNVINKKLDVSRGLVIFRSRPDEAKLHINDKFVGYTPMNKVMDFGEYTIKFSKQGFDEEEFSQRIGAPVVIEKSLMKHYE